MPFASGLSRYTIAVVGLLLIAWAATNPAFRDQGHLNARICLPIALAIAAFVLSLSSKRAWQASGAWLALLIAGQAAALQLIQPTRLVGYQHYKVLGDLGALTDVFCLLLIAAQACVVILALWPARYVITGWLRSTFRVWQLGAVALLAGFAASAPSLNLVDYGIELLLAGFIQLINLMTVIVLVRSIPPGPLDTLGQILRKWHLVPTATQEPEPGGIDRFVLLCTLCVITISVLLSIFAYERHPHIADEVAYLLQAEYLSQGLLAMPLPPVPEAFNIDLMIYEQERWFSAFPPGWPAMLAAGSFLGAPWLVNPMLAGLCVLLAYLLARELYSRGTARLIILLLCCSPWFIFLAMSYMAHIFTLACVLAAACAIARLRRHAGLVTATFAGTMLGITSLIRPLDGLAAAVLLGLWSLGVKTWRVRLTAIPVFVIASVLVGALVLPYNNHLTGDPAVFPVMAYFDQYYGEGINALGFGPDKGLDWRGLDPFPGHGLRDVVLNNYLNVFAVNVELFGWSTGSLLPILILLLVGAAKRMDYQMLLVILMVAGLHSLYWFNGGPDFGARYWFLMLFPLLALTVRGVTIIGTRLPDSRHGTTQAVAGILALCITSTVTFIPWRAIDKYFHYKNMRPDIRQLEREHDFSNGLVLVNGGRFNDYMSAAVYNVADVTSGTTIYAWDRSPEVRARLLSAFRHRSIWLVDGPTVTGTEFSVVEGPLTPGELRLREPQDTAIENPAGQNPE